ncbi:MAG TPA: hypothetical protein VLC47_05495 [Burkholderiales bacterium]|nr:hypothetical protein [Burkholderiales bacterium]
MERTVRTEIFGRHVISATARSASRSGRRLWEVDVAAVVLGRETDSPLVRFSPPERISDDPSAALDAAVEKARRELVASESP